MAKTIVLVDDDPVVLDGWQRQIEKLGYSVVGAFSSAEQALRWVQAGGRADLGLIDIGLPGMDGIELIAKLRHLRPEMGLVVLTIFDDAPTVLDALRAGARCYLLKDASTEELWAALQSVESGGAALADIAAKHVLDHLYAEGLREPTSSTKDLLTARERQVLSSLSRGLTYAEVASALRITLGTVQSHVKAIYRKLGVTNIAQAMALGLHLQAASKARRL